MLALKKIFTDERLYIILLGLLPLTWFHANKQIVGIDSLIPYHLPSFINEYFNVWSHKAAWGISDLLKLPYLVPLGILLKLYQLTGLPFSSLIYQKIILISMFMGAGLSNRTLFITIVPQSTKVARFLAGMMYMCNFYVMFLLFAHPLNLLFSYSFFPFVFSKMIKLIQAPTLKNALQASIIWFLLLTPGYTATPYIIIHVGIFVSYAFYHIIVNKPSIMSLIKYGVVTGLCWLLLNSFWIYPTYLNLGYELTAYQNTAELGQDAMLVAANSARFIDSFRLMGYFGLTGDYAGSPYYPWFKPFTENPLIIISFILPGIAFLGIAHKPSKQYLYLVALALIFIFAIKGTLSPFNYVNSFFYERLHLFTLFRTGYQRFTAILALFYALLIPATINSFSVNKNTKTYYFLIGITIAATISITHPLFTNTLFTNVPPTPSMNVKIPDSYYKMSEFLEQQPETNILPVPYNGLGLGLLWWNNGQDGYASSYPMGLLNKQRYITSSLASDLPPLIVNNLDKPESVKLLGLLNTKYILFHNDADWKYIEKHPWWVGKPQEQITQKLKSNPDLTLVQQQGDLELYEINNRLYLPHIYIPNALLAPQHNMINTLAHSTSFAPVISADNLSIPTNIPEINVQKKTTTSYDIQITHAREPFTLVFTETYNPHWQLNIDKKPLNLNHYTVNSFTNAWVINPEELCQSHSCQNSAEGKQFSLQISYLGQKNFLLGSTISAITFVIAGTLLLIIKKHEKSI